MHDNAKDDDVDKPRLSLLARRQVLAQQLHGTMALRDRVEGNIGVAPTVRRARGASLFNELDALQLHMAQRLRDSASDSVCGRCERADAEPRAGHAYTHFCELRSSVWVTVVNERQESDAWGSSRRQDGRH